MATIRFSVKPLGNGNMIIRAMLQHLGSPIKYKALGYTIPDNKVKGEYKYWDIKKYRVRAHDKQIEINKKIAKWQSDFNTYLDHCQRGGIDINLEDFKRMLDEDRLTLPKKADFTLLSVVAAEFYNSLLKTHKHGTTKQYLTMLDNITAFEVYAGRQFKLADIDKEFYKEYGLFLIEKDNNYNNTINRKIGRIITLMNYAFDKKYIDTLDWKRRYTFKGSPAQRFALWPDELQKLRDMEITIPYERKVLDSFLFSCETTLRHSDVSILLPVHKKDIPTEQGVISILDLTQEKTINANTLALTSYAQMLWQRNVRGPKTPVFNIPQSNTATRVVKRICKIAGLNRPCEVVKTQGSEIQKVVMPLYEAIGFHMARNTAITSQLSKLAPAYVKDNAGIKKMDTLMGYYKDDTIARYKKTLEAMNETKKKGADDN